MARAIPRGINQSRYKLLLENPSVPVVIGIGPAGTGKTLFACQAAATRLKERKVERIIMTRPAVSVDESHGFLPGSLENKMDPWVRPMFDVLARFYSQNEIRIMVRDRIVEVCPLAYMRGRTFDHSFILADEMQNSTPNQMRMVLSRLGDKSKIVVMGDTAQHESGFEVNGLSDLLGRLDPYEPDIQSVLFSNSDIERNKVIEKVLDMYT
jgi:phosphate starvation-inducible PhoH-like protein